MIKEISCLILGIYIGQEYGKDLPLVKDKFSEYFKEIEKSELYKNLIKK